MVCHMLNQGWTIDLTDSLKNFSHPIMIYSGESRHILDNKRLN